MTGADALTIALSVWVACEIRGHWDIWGQGNGATGIDHLCVTFGPWMAAGWLGWLAMRGSYSQKIFAGGGQEFSRVFTASLLAAGTVAMACYLAKYDLSRGFVCLTFLIGAPALLGERLAVRELVHFLRRRGRMQRRLIVLGSPYEVEAITEILRRERYAGYAVVGACTHGDAALTVLGSTRDPIPMLGHAADIRDVALRAGADGVLVAGGQSIGADDVRRTAWALEGTDVDLIVVPSLTDIAGPRVHIRPVAGLPLLHVEPPQANEAIRWGKRAFDLLAAGALLVITAPIWLVTAISIKAHDGGAVFFRQQRIGLHGRPFTCLKFRSMHEEAESQRESLTALNELDGPLFKMAVDPRVTRVGRTIRRYSLDELPQLLNVLRGEMSLVGPRPPLPSEVSQYDGSVARRLLVRPGMTGLWQVSGRASLPWRDAVRLDLYYVDNWSLWQDVVILGKTLKAVLRPQGAS